MTIVFNFQVPGLPVPKQRARVSTDPKTGQVRAYYPKRARGSKRPTYPEFKQQVWAHARNAMVKEGIHLPEPDEESEWLLWINPYLHNRTDGDVDNLAGTFMDALQGLVYKNDIQVRQVYVRRYIGKKSVEPWTDVMVEQAVDV